MLPDSCSNINKRYEERKRRKGGEGEEGEEKCTLSLESLELPCDDGELYNTKIKEKKNRK